MLVLIKQDTHLSLTVLDGNYPLRHITDATISSWSLEDTVWLELEITGDLQLTFISYVANNPTLATNIFISR